MLVRTQKERARKEGGGKRNTRGDEQRKNATHVRCLGRLRLCSYILTLLLSNQGFVVRAIPQTAKPLEVDAHLPIHIQTDDA